MQDIWQLNLDWDEPFNREHWLGIVNDLTLSPSITLPGSYFGTQRMITSSQLHVFVGGSPKAYGAVAYVKQNENVSFAMAKVVSHP